MNAEEFYKSFKEALDYLGCSWGNKEDATVILDGDKVRVSYENREAAFTVGKK